MSAAVRNPHAVSRLARPKLAIVPPTTPTGYHNTEAGIYCAQQMWRLAGCLHLIRGTTPAGAQ